MAYNTNALVPQTDQAPTPLVLQESCWVSPTSALLLMLRLNALQTCELDNGCGFRAASVVPRMLAMRWGKQRCKSINPEAICAEGSSLLSDCAGNWTAPFVSPPQRWPRGLSWSFCAFQTARQLHTQAG